MTQRGACHEETETLLAGRKSGHPPKAFTKITVDELMAAWGEVGNRGLLVTVHGSNAILSGQFEGGEMGGDPDFRV